MSGMTFSSNENVVSMLPEAVTLAQELLADLLSAINSINAITAAHEALWNRQIAELSSDISQFVELTTLITRLIQKEKKLAPTAIKESHIHLLFILKAMTQAQAKKDLIALEDLIKYELKDNLTQWKIDLIPQTKRLLNA